MKLMRLSAGTALPVLAALAAFHAAAVPAADALDETVVTATRSAARLDELAVPVVVITREDIERSLAMDVGDLLQQHAGIEVARNGGPGQAASLFIRGTSSDHAVVLVDGVRINPGTIGGAAIQNIAPDTVERIEVVKGPRSSLYGTDAIGGVVNILTRAAARPGFAAAVSGGRYGSATANLDGGIALGERAGLGVSFGHTRSDGFPTLAASDTARGYRNTTLNLFARLAATDSLELRGRAWRAAGNSEYSDFFVTPVDQDFENAAYAVEGEWKPRDGLRTRVNLSRVLDDVRQNQSSDFVRTRRNALDAQADVQLGASHRLTLGALLTREDTDSESFGTTFDVRTDVRMFFVQDRWRIGDRQDALLALGHTHHDTFGDAVTWNAEYGVTLPTRTRLSAAAGTAFHAPDSTDRFGFGGNPALAPEHSRQVELSVRQPLGARQQLFLTAFRNRVDDLVSYVVTDFVTFAGRNENVERARIRGVEAGWSLRGELWSARAEASFQDPRNLTSGERLLRRARHTFTAAVQRRVGRTELGVDVLASGERRDAGFPSAVRLDRYTLVNLSARHALTPRWSVQARLDNALDERYQLAYGYNTPRRSFVLATRYDLR